MVKEVQEITETREAADADKKEIVVKKKKKKQHVGLKNAACMLMILFLTVGTAYCGCLYFRLDIYHTVKNLILCMTGGLILIFSYQAGRLSGSFSYDDGEHPGRFMLLYLGGILCSMIFLYLPVTGWMFLFFYVALARVSDSVTGMCAGTSLLVLTTVFCEQISLSVFLIYLFSGMIGIALFAHQKGEVSIVIPLGLSLGIQLVLIFSGELLIQNRKFMWESALIPFANTIMNGILLCFFMQYYVNKVARKVPNLYLMLNDPEYEAMKKKREEAEEEYYHAVHTAYLTERLAGEMELDVMAAKCAAYYLHFTPEEQEELPIPEHAGRLLMQLTGEKGKLQEKEAVIVRICDSLITIIQHVKKERAGEKTDYGDLVRRLFEKRFTIEAFADTDITLSNLRYIGKRLMEEEMYYEFIIK